MEKEGDELDVVRKLIAEKLDERIGGDRTQSGA